MADCIWPQRTRPLRQLTEAQYAAWERDGFVVLPGLIPSDLCANAAAVIRKYIGADDARPETWYTNTQDIYDATLSPRPAHGPCGMVQLYHHATLWALRQHPAIHACFADVYGTERLYVTCDRAHFKPPQSAAHPAWSDAGPVHSGLHWDVDVKNTPVPLSVQGVVYLEDTMADTARRGDAFVVAGASCVHGGGRRGRGVPFSGLFASVWTSSGSWGLRRTTPSMEEGVPPGGIRRRSTVRVGTNLTGRAFRPMSRCCPSMPRRSLAIGPRIPLCR